MDKNEFNAKLASQRIVLLSQEITLKQVDTAKYWLTVLNLESPEPIKLIIDSDGGLAEPSLWIYDAIKLSRAPVIGIVSGRCKSMAVIVLQACTKRFSTPHSCFFLHPIKMRIAAACDYYLDTVIAARKTGAKTNRQYSHGKDSSYPDTNSKANERQRKTRRLYATPRSKKNRAY